MNNAWRARACAHAHRRHLPLGPAGRRESSIPLAAGMERIRRVRARISRCSVCSSQDGRCTPDRGRAGEEPALAAMWGRLGGRCVLAVSRSGRCYAHPPPNRTRCRCRAPCAWLRRWFRLTGARPTHAFRRHKRCATTSPAAPGPSAIHKTKKKKKKNLRRHTHTNNHLAHYSQQPRQHDT
jgi:hypothetical protein